MYYFMIFIYYLLFKLSISLRVKKDRLLRLRLNF